MLVFYLRVGQPSETNFFLLKFIPMSYLSLGVLFLNFTYHLLRKNPDKILYGFSFIMFGSILINLFTNIFVTGYIKSNWGYHLDASHPLSFYLTFTCIFLPSFLGTFNLIKKNKKDPTNPLNKQIKIIIVGSLSTWSLLIISEYLVFIYGMYEVVRLGPISSAAISLFILPAIIKYNFITPSKREISTKLFSSLPDAVFLLDENGIIIESNKVAEKIIESSNASHEKTIYSKYLFLNYSHSQNYSNHITKLLPNQIISVSISQNDYKELGFKLGKILIVRDISKILLSEQQLKQAQEVSNTGSFQYDIITNTVTWSEELYKIYQKDSEIYTPTNHSFFSDIIHPDEKNRIKKIVDQNIISGEPFEYTYKILLLNNEVRIMHCKCIVTQNHENVSIRIDGTAQDITELESARKKLHESDEKHRNLFEYSPEAIVIHNEDSIFYCNDAAVKLSGLNSKEELHALKVANFFSSDYIKNIQRDIVDYISGVHIEIKNEEIILPNGSSIFIEVRGVRTEFEGEPAIQSSIRNVTAKILADRQLIESEERYRGAIENSSDIIYNTDLDGNLTFANSVFESVSGYSETEVLGKDVNILVAPSHQTLIKKEYYKFFQSPDKNLITSVMAQTKSDENIWLEMNINKIYEGAIIVGFTSIARDITLRKKIEKALSESEEKYRLLVENSTELIYKIDLDGNYTYVNQILVNNTDYTEEELLKMNCFETILDDYQDDTRNFYTTQIKSKKETTYYEVPCYGKNKKVIWISQLSQLQFNKDGKPVGFSITGRDITEKHHAERALINSEERLAIAQEISHMGNWEENHKTGIIYWSDECKNIFEFNIEEPVLRGMFWDIVHPEDENKLRKIWAGITEKMEPYEGTFRIVLKDGTIKHIREKAEFETDSDGKLFLTRGTVQDITEIEESNIKLENSQIQLRDLTKHLQTIQEEERAHIAREIHDELGQRLTGIKMDISWISHKIPPENKTIFERLNSLNRLIDDTVQSVRKISSDLHPVMLDDLGLKAAMEWQISEFNRRSNIKCDLVMNEAEFDFKPIQEKTLFRIMQESLTNIMRHAKADKVSIILEKNKDGILFSIKDNGVGIKNYDENIHKTFGILSMKERAYSLGGELSISSKLNKGTKINLFIPTQLEHA